MTAVATVEPRLTTGEVAEVSRRHPVTILKALESGRLHGSQQGKGGRWTVRASCLDAWLDGMPCEHQHPTARVIPMASRRAS